MSYFSWVIVLLLTQLLQRWLRRKTDPAATRCFWWRVHVVPLQERCTTVAVVFEQHCYRTWWQDPVPHFATTGLHLLTLLEAGSMENDNLLFKLRVG